MNHFNEEISKKIINLGSLGYPRRKCLNILQLNEEDAKIFLEQFYKQGSEVNTAYQMGVDLADFEIDTKLYQLAKTGELKAIKELALKKQSYREEERKNNIHEGRS